ncbi:hypothetical protein CAPTEDRAFT_218226 [Capitella teleta]|uniref:Uncharacterized protein n=1 Tax=Capitella teleta TaxID=283909 RepID=R7TWK8_CAPTE|nr:hypothetical protein CAPTEDRAFT_218226 [Capitella teleta]|eukprot:ELT95796.1 hypothetical protein CAPTEDRAFT_218226 [Capitella teleta]
MNTVLLENKLSRLRGRRSPDPQTNAKVAKEMLKGLAESREGQMQSFMESDVEASNDVIVDCSTQDGTLDNLQRRLNPEKQALNEEEKKALVENDELAKMWHQANSDMQIILHSPEKPAA